MMPKSPVLKALIGKQKNLNEGLKAAIMASPAKQMSKLKESPAKAHCKSPVKQKMEMVEVNGKKVPKFAADGKGAGDLKKGSPAKGYKSAAQRKAVHASKADGGAGHPDKKKSPAKQIGVNKKDTKAFETTKRLENKGERKIARLEKRKKKVVDRINKKAERKATRILSKKSPAKKYGKSPAKAHCNKK